MVLSHAILETGKEYEESHGFQPHFYLSSPPDFLKF